MIRILLIILFFTSLPLSAQARQYECKITRINQCGAEGCRPRESTAYRKIDISTGKFSRCNWEGCNDYRADVTDAGSHWEMRLNGEFAIAKMSKDGSEFIDMMMLGPIAFVTFGSCRPAE